MKKEEEEKIDFFICKRFLPMKKAGSYALNNHSCAAVLIFWFIPPFW
jgi:hypothetical protein